MGLLKKIFWPDHPDDVAARQDAADIASRAPARAEEDQALQSLWTRLLPTVTLYDGPAWNASYNQRPIDDSREFNWNFGNLVQDLGSFEPLNRRVPPDISDGMRSGVKRKVVRDYWAHVTRGAIQEIAELIDLRERVVAVRSPEGRGLVGDYYRYADRFCLYHLPYLIADTQVTRAIWNEDVTAKSDWLNAVQRAEEPRQRELTNLQTTLRRLAREQHEDFDRLGYSAFIGLGDLSD